MRRLILAGLLFTLTHAYATDLLSVYQDAMQNSPLPKSYLATYQAAHENIPIAAGALLPQLNLTAGGIYSRITAPGQNYSYPDTTYMLTLSQTLFDYTNVALTVAANDSSNAARATYASNMQNFMFTIVQNYVSVLLAEDNVSFAKSQVDSLKAILNQTRAKFSVGLATYTDVLQAKSNYDSAITTLLKNQNTLSDAQESLNVLTANKVSNLATLKPEFPLLRPSPDNVQFWITHALKNNPALIAQHYTTRSALANANASGGSLLPTVNLEASYGRLNYYRNGPNFVNSGLPHKMTAMIALDLNWTIFNGGAQTATLLQAANQYTGAQNTELALYRQTRAQTEQDFLSVGSTLSQAQAYALSVTAAQSSLNNDLAKYKVGTGTIVEVLQDTETLYQAKSSLASAVNSYILSLFQLKLDAGLLRLQDLTSLNQYLQVNQ